MTHRLLYMVMCTGDMSGDVIAIVQLGPGQTCPSLPHAQVQSALINPDLSNPEYSLSSMIFLKPIHFLYIFSH